MSYPEKIQKNVEKIRELSEEILNKGVLKECKYLDIQHTLEVHKKIKILLEDLDYNLNSDIPDEIALEKVKNTKEKLKKIRKQIEKDQNMENHKLSKIQKLKDQNIKEER